MQAKSEWVLYADWPGLGRYRSRISQVNEHRGELRGNHMRGRAVVKHPLFFLAHDMLYIRCRMSEIIREKF